jgi:hypothetical protein
MPKLLIVGNGVDIELGLKTDHASFGQWVINKYHGLLGDIFREIYPSPFDNSSSGFWKTFESNTANIQNIDFFDTFIDCGFDFLFYELAKETEKALAEWAANKDAESFNTGFKPLEKVDFASIVTFNYTSSIANLLQSNNNKHLHVNGSAILSYFFSSDKCLFGHKPNEPYFNRIYQLVKHKEEYKRFFDSSTRDTDEGSQKFLAEWNSSSDKYSIVEVEVVGCSYSEIDEPYIVGTISTLAKETKVNMWAYSATDVKNALKYQEILTKLGYRLIIIKNGNPRWLTTLSSEFKRFKERI